MVSVGNECRQTLFSAQYVNIGFTSDAVVYLSLAVDVFRCKRCDGTIQEADLAGDLVVDGETYGCVKRFCYLGVILLRWWSGSCCYS